MKRGKPLPMKKKKKKKKGKMNGQKESGRDGD